MSKFWIIASDVYKKNVKSVSFVVMILVPFIVMGIIYIAGSVAGGFSEDTKVGLVSDNQELSKQLAKSKTDDYTFKVVTSQKEAEKQLKNKELDAFLVLDTETEQIQGKLYAESSLGTTTELMMGQMLNGLQSSLNASKLNLTPEQLTSLSQPANFEKTKVSFDEDGKMTTGQDNTAIQSAMSFVITIILWVIIITYASIIAQEIASEKGTRIMEVILSSTKAQTHFYGKLTGVILVALTQIVIYAAAIGLGYTQLKNLDMVKGLLDGLSSANILGSFLYFTLAFFVLGILVYSVLAALCGSLVSKPEDTAKAVQPIIYIAMIGYFIGISLGTTDPQNIVIKVSSYIPLISSFIMPIRLASETVTTAGAMISVVILVVFGLLLTMFSAKLYKSNVLVYSEGGVLKSLKQSISILRNERKK
ncbi:sodium ABC transporter permease [Enterococcus ureilyticus]|uniref:Sodium ABC transporter permease n=1 Tax=Enterococcus ureilyticus TaxID=1131292 RepID=A0A1E5H9X4_9ENTE|nr:ABC transporter permease [Enterococcus ureilyticus]MBM7688312.1 ABC-2 type transport system permease protein [Enterococcus ureilyticus]MBO0444978.1 ABC transporter permease [Enterococcus ureilyticus]OEG21752.1 sodium ABC transporter permease [Enterococcus ureilyticus]